MLKDDEALVFGGHLFHISFNDDLLSSRNSLYEYICNAANNESIIKSSGQIAMQYMRLKIRLLLARILKYFPLSLFIRKTPSHFFNLFRCQLWPIRLGNVPAYPFDKRPELLLGHLVP